MKKNAHNKGKVLRTTIFGRKYYADSPKKTIKQVVAVNALLMVFMIVAQGYGFMMTLQEEEPLLSPLPETVAQAKEVEPILEPTPEPEEFTIEGYIREVFGDHADQALTIADCESKMDPTRIGDRNLIVWHGDDIVGDSVGLFQIRTGGRDFNRARANGLSPDDFRELMLDPKENIDYAKEIFDRQGWEPWTCKKDL